MTVLAIIIAVLIALLTAVGFLLANFSMAGGKRQTLEEARAWQESHYDFSWYDPMEKTDYTVTSYDGYVLHAQFLKNPCSTGRCILISHGYTDNRFGALKYAQMYLEQGFSVIVYDLRGHGQNKPDFCTYSVRERKDLLAMIEDSRKRYPNVTLFGIHGESLGAATSVAVLENHPPVDFVVADCGFSDIVPVLKIGLKMMHLPGFLVYIASVCAKIRFGYSFRRMQPISSLKGNTVPVLFIHGADDHFIVPEHSEKMKNEANGCAKLCLVPGAPHAASILTDPVLYRKTVADFLTEQFPGR